VKPVRGELRTAVIHEPREIPTTIAAGVAESAPAWDTGGSGTGGTGDGNGNGIGVSGGVEGGLGPVLNVAWTAKPPVLPSAPPAAPKRLAVSQGVAEGLLLHRVVPAYPELARRARISGAVTLRAVIGKEGTIENLRLTSGHPMLAQAALDAVRQWRYRPYLLNREPVEVDTEITVNFNLAQ
jgi:protein TonB